MSSPVDTIREALRTPPMMWRTREDALAALTEVEQQLAAYRVNAAENARLAMAAERRANDLQAALAWDEEQALRLVASRDALADALRAIAALGGGYPDDYCAIARAALDRQEQPNDPDFGEPPPQVEQDPASGRWYRLDAQGNRLHGPYLSEDDATPAP